MLSYFEVLFARKNFYNMKKTGQVYLLRWTQPSKPFNTPHTMNTRFLSFGLTLALAGAVRLAAQTSAGFTAEVDGPWMRDFLLRHPEYKEVVTDGDFSTRVLITDPSLYLYIRETAPDKVGTARALAPEQLREAREKAMALRRTLDAPRRPGAEELRRQEADARREAGLRDRHAGGADYGALSAEALEARLAELKEALRQAASDAERLRLEEELRRALYHYNQRINMSNPQ